MCMCCPPLTLSAVYMCSFQELDLSAQCLVSGESSREELWVEAVEKSLKRVGVYAKVTEPLYLCLCVWGGGGGGGGVGGDLVAGAVEKQASKEASYQ